MVQRNLPTGSVRDPRAADASESSRVSTAGARERSYQERIDALEREIGALEAELDRRDERLQDVIDRYEAVLADQRREYERRIGGPDRGGSTPGRTLRDRLLDLVRPG